MAEHRLDVLADLSHQGRVHELLGVELVQHRELLVFEDGSGDQHKVPLIYEGSRKQTDRVRVYDDAEENQNAYIRLLLCRHSRLPTDTGVRSPNPTVAIVETV